MAELILHQVLRSAHGEMIRLILGFKGLRWREVGIPVVLPRPLLAPLAGPYRRHPVLQVGADIYCDSRSIIRFLEERFPTPALSDASEIFFDELIALWVEPRVFMTGAALVRYQSPEFLDDYFGKDLPREVLVRDRQALLAGTGLDAAKLAAQLPYALDQLRAFLELVEARLDDHRAFLAGDAPSLADFSVFTPLYLVNMRPRVSLLDRFPRVLAWLKRMSAIGYGDVLPMDAEEALEIGRESTPTRTTETDSRDPVGRRPGARVSVAADDYGMDPVVGELVSSGPYDIALRRHDPLAGEIVQHFPKVGFRVLPADADA